MSGSTFRHSSFFRQQPVANPHERFLTRNTTNCPSHLTGSKRTKWFKAGRKAQNNQRLLATLNYFHEPDSTYDLPIFIHRRTAESHIHGIVHKISNVRLYTIDTEADKPTRQHPHSLPALVQVQAIHDEHYSTVIIIEVQHLPHPSTSLFRSIQKLCRTIFSSSNKIMTWGDVRKELNPFEQFDLFDLSEVIHTVNLQKYFTREWNRTHPHTEDCLGDSSTIR